MRLNCDDDRRMDWNQYIALTRRTRPLHRTTTFRFYLPPSSSSNHLSPGSQSLTLEVVANLLCFISTHEPSPTLYISSSDRCRDLVNR
ncbi:hypothetical protein CY34DRAFT_811950 [Suillus luteus UH-Slu-Lm8-n1]|uniref:Uncharacterized protein n=1 Tax=Suillus luteus UH-Slu-Lm8-n1 TaxID=930992 RepID=A0A0D0A1P7_9AGAM|nr:hypothetical protein CY34DRAFT_811950 [Suillus luteus UH-Slu-Lm8-n1]